MFFFFFFLENNDIYKDLQRLHLLDATSYLIQLTIKSLSIFLQLSVNDSAATINFCVMLFFAYHS